MSERPISEYDRRMHAVLEYIDAHLDRALELRELAAIAHFSSFHFHRVFSLWAGEMLGEYVRRRRVEMAAVRLRAQPALSVLQVALGVGFASGEAFARAFRSGFGCTPTQWRLRKPGQVNSNRGQANRSGSPQAVAPSQHPETVMQAAIQVKLIDRPPVEIVYMRHVGPYGAELSQFWQEIVYPWMATNNLLGLPRYGVSLDDPTVTRPGRCRYDAGVDVGERSVLSGKPMRRTIAGGRYASVRFFGSVDQIAAAWDEVLRDWLPQSGLQLDARPFFEYYPPDARFDARTGQFECQLCVPVAPL